MNVTPLSNQSFGAELVYKNKKTESRFKKQVAWAEQGKLHEEVPNMKPANGKDITIQVSHKKKTTKGLVTGEYDHFTFTTKDGILGRALTESLEFRVGKSQRSHVVNKTPYEGEKVIPVIQRLVRKVSKMRALKK